MPTATDKSIEFGSHLQRIVVSGWLTPWSCRCRRGAGRLSTWLPPADDMSLAAADACLTRQGRAIGPACPGHLHAARWPGLQGPVCAPIRCCLPAGQRTCCPAVCAQTCGWLVRNGAKPVHRRWKCWGFRSLAGTRRGHLPGRARNQACAYREISNYPHAAL